MQNERTAKVHTLPSESHRWRFAVVPVSSLVASVSSACAPAVRRVNGGASEQLYNNEPRMCLPSERVIATRTFVFQRTNFDRSTAKASFAGDHGNRHGIFGVRSEHARVMLLITAGVDATVIAKQLVAAEATGEHLGRLPFDVKFAATNLRNDRRGR